MHNQNEEFFMTKKKKPSFAEWTLQNGITQKPASTTVGVGVPDDPHSRTNQQATVKTTTTKPQTRDPFLEGFYSTDDKPETERKTYLQHRTPAVDRVSPETKKPQPIKLPYRPSVQGPPKMTKLPYIPAQDGAPKMTQYRKQTTPAYDSPVKIVGDNVTKKDYDDFWNAFRNEGTGDKLNWATNIAKPQNTARRQYVTDKDVKTINTEMDADKVYEDNFWGQVGANYYEGSFELEEKQAWDKYNQNPTLENKRIAEDISAALKNFRQRNSEVLENDITPAWIVREFAGELPEILDGMEDGIKQKDLGMIQDAFSDSMDEIEDKAKDIHYSRNQYNVDLPRNSTEAEKLGWRDGVAANCHQFTAEDRKPHIKYVSPDGRREVIFDSEGNYVITADEDMGTYNYADPDLWMEHFVVDILPWIIYGNSPEDSTEMDERIGASISGKR